MAQADLRNQMKRPSTSKMSLKSDEQEETSSKRSKLDSALFKIPEPVDDSAPRSSGSLASRVKDSDRVRGVSHQQQQVQPSTSAQAQAQDMAAVTGAVTSLPDGFFDDPDLDAKVRGIDLAKNFELEYEEFKRVMKSETAKSDTIVEQDDEERDIDRQLAEVEDLIGRWSRIEELHKQRDALMERRKKAAEPMSVDGNGHSNGNTSKQMNGNSNKNGNHNDEDDSDDDEVDLSSVLSLDIRDKKRC
jgi:hypothetical protein